MGISPWYVGASTPPAVLTISDDSGDALPLTGATITSMLHNVNTGISTAMTGTWTIINATQGIAQYAWSAADVANAGNYTIQPIVTVAGKETIADPIPFLVISI